MRNLALHLVINALALWAASHFVDGVALTSDPIQALMVALVFGLVNAFIRPVIKFLSFPVILFSLGLFTIVINGAMLWLTSVLTPYLVVEGWVPALLGAVVISVASVVLSWFLRDGKRGR